MYNTAQQAELKTLITSQFEKLGEHLAKPMEPGDTIYVFDDLPAWLGEGLEHRFVVLSPGGKDDPSGTFLACMDVHFGDYHRRMELVAGSREKLHEFATVNPPIVPICEAIYELMAMEKAGR